MVIFGQILANFCSIPVPLTSDFLFRLQPPPPPIPTNPPAVPPQRACFGPFRLRFGPFRVRFAPFGSVSGLFRVRFGSVSGPLGGVGVGSGGGASVKEKNISTLDWNPPKTIAGTNFGQVRGSGWF